MLIEAVTRRKQHDVSTATPATPTTPDSPLPRVRRPACSGERLKRDALGNGHLLYVRTWLQRLDLYELRAQFTLRAKLSGFAAGSQVKQPERLRWFRAALSRRTSLASGKRRSDAYLSRRATTPGSVRPSRNSRGAPPPVE